jgi:hypothetical protein
MNKKNNNNSFTYFSGGLLSNLRFGPIGLSSSATIGPSSSSITQPTPSDEQYALQLEQLFSIHRTIIPTTGSVSDSNRNPTRLDENFINRRNPIGFLVAIRHPDP